MKHKMTKMVAGALALAAIASPLAASAADSGNATVNITVPESISLTLSASTINLTLSDTTLKTGNITVTGTTNSSKGYKISMKTNGASSALVNSTATSSTIPSITAASTASNFPATGWGYATTTSNPTYNAIPTTVTSIFTTAAAGQTAHTFVAGARVAAGAVAGTYSNTLVFSIVANT